MAGVASRGRRRAALPAPPNALVGRDVEVAALVGLITAADTRLLTLTGPPGVGKTRLAVAAAAATAAAEHFADGVAFVDLTAVRDPAAVAGALGGVLGAGGTGAADAPGHLDGTRADPELLVVLDNFEHVLDAGPALAAVLADSVRLRVLVTSRERLRLRAEREFSVQPLGLPDPGDDADRVAETSAVAMLVQRVRAFRPEFAVTTANRDAVAEICVRLDGLPLALELAAARLRLFTPGELTFRLRHRMTVLASSIRDVPERHRTLRAALSWSHDLLTPPERVAFRRFSVFVGGATIEAVEQACGGDRVVDDVMSLVDKSLLERRTHGDRTRFVMLESLREFAGELLDEPAGGPTRLQHARFYAALAARTEAVIGTADETASIADAGVEQGNLRAALECALAAGQAEWALRLAAALGWYYYTRGRLGEANATLDRAVAAADLVRGTVPEDPLGAALLISGVVAYGRGELDGAAERLGRCGRILARTGDLRRIAITSAFLGHLARARGDYDAAAVHHERAGRLHDRLGNDNGVAWADYDLGLLARRRGRLPAAARHLRAALSRFRESGYTWAVGCATWAIATVELRRDRPGEAAALVAEAMAGFAAVDDRRGIAQCLEAAAAVARARRRSGDAARLLGAAAALRDRLAAPLPEEDRDQLDGVVRGVRGDLGPDAADRARCVGRALSQADAVALARRTVAGPPPGCRQAAPLTPREREVAGLVAGGRTNRQIGRALGITEKTAEVHVHNIIRKLDASSRAEIAAWAATQIVPS